MNRRFTFLALVFVGMACNGTPPANTVPTIEVQERPLPSSYGEFVDEVCGTWATFNRGDAEMFLRFYDRAQELIATPQFSEHAFRILGDPSLWKCWTAPAYIIGFAGAEADILRLLNHLDSLKPGTWTFERASDAANVSHYQAYIREGLALGANRLGEGHELTTRILSHLEDCTRASYWLAEGRTPKLKASWYPEEDVEEVQAAVVMQELEQSVSAMGYAGLSSATERLVRRYQQALSEPFWMDAVVNGEITRFRLAIDRSVGIKNLGFERHFREHTISY